jgi:hypothetical protein
MKRYFPILLGSVLILVAACAPVTPAVPLPAPTQTTVTSSEYYPLETRTGIAPVDRVLAAIASGDPQALRSVVEFTETGCTHKEGFGGPPKCREGEAEGTPVRALAFLGSEGGHLREEEIEQWIGVRADGVHAVYAVSGEVYSDEYFPAGHHAIVLVDGESPDGTILRIGETGIVRVDTIFDISPESLSNLLEREAGTIILGP